MENSYFEIKLRIDSTYLELIMSFVSDLVNDAIEYGDDFIIIRVENNVEDIELNIKNHIEELSKNIGYDIDYSIHVKQKENVDWIQKYKDSIQPIEVGKFYIRPTWCEKKDGLIDIIINPALAFGSGHHPTTNSCLNFISKYVNSDDSVVDVGCGSGILSIAAVKLGARVDVCDTDQQAIDSTNENFEFNGEKFNNAWTGSVTQTNNEYDIVIANIVADVLVFIASDLQKSCKSGGKIILSGILEKNQDRVKSKFDKLNLIDNFSDGEWVSLVYQK
jgi:ribosomal protein L11 methyltransferase